jgi:lincosamide and streptogramin A transport system ATP-binding/permease protein
MDADDILYRTFVTLSGGEKTKVLLAGLFLRDDAYPLIDEPTNHLDLHAREIVSKYLGNKRGFLLVSHDRAFLDGCVDHIMAINKTQIEIQKGTFSSWYENKERKDRFEQTENAKLQKEIGALQQAARRAGAWADDVERTKYHTRNSGLRPDRGYLGHQSAKMMKRAKSMERRISASAEEKSKLLRDVETTETLEVKTLPYRTDRLLFLEDVSLFYGDRAVRKQISLTVKNGERIALLGGNGSGKSSMLKLITQTKDKPAHTGTVQIGSGLIVSYVPQDTTFLKGGMRTYAESCGADETLFRTMLSKLDFTAEEFEQEMETFSEGQKKKS